MVVVVAAAAVVTVVVLVVIVVAVIIVQAINGLWGVGFGIMIRDFQTQSMIINVQKQ